MIFQLHVFKMSEGNRNCAKQAKVFQVALRLKIQGGQEPRLQHIQQRCALKYHVGCSREQASKTNYGSQKEILLLGHQGASFPCPSNAVQPTEHIRKMRGVFHS